MDSAKRRRGNGASYLGADDGPTSALLRHWGRMLRYDALLEVRLGDQHKPTGATRHWKNGSLLPPPASLRIVRYDRQEGFSLL
jgi:hypothetical protein